MFCNGRLSKYTFQHASLCSLICDSYILLISPLYTFPQLQETQLINSWSMVDPGKLWSGLFLKWPWQWIFHTLVWCPHLGQPHRARMLAKWTFFLYYLPLPCLLPSLPQVTTSYQADEGQWVDSCESCAFHVNTLPLSIHVFISSFILINYLFQNYTRADLDINHKYIIFFIQVLKIYIVF